MDAITVMLAVIAVTALIIALLTQSKAAMLLDRVVRLERELWRLTNTLEAAGTTPEQAAAAGPRREPAPQASPPPLVAAAGMVGISGLRIVPHQGALPIWSEGRCIGSIGVSGARSDQDEDAARAGIKAAGFSERSD